MEQLKFLIDLFIHLDEYMANIITQYGTWTYAILFFVIFMETGFVVISVLARRLATISAVRRS